MTYETVIGLEVHVELSTASKIFCSCPTLYGQAPNTQCCPVCTGLPGALPVLNRQVVEYALRTCLALNCDISSITRFDRKNYFYPDLPKAYQISQLYSPIGRDGWLEIEAPNGVKRIRVHELHMEEDAGKLTHDPWEDSTLVDYNRCGVPLLEIVSEPDLRSADEAFLYLEKMRSVLQFLGVSDCRMEEGSLRADVNVSVRPIGQAEFGTRTEMKNMNSFKAIKRAIEKESQRQIELLEDGGAVIQETRRWDENKDASFAMRSKEDAHDYRYFPDPDLSPVRIDDEWISRVKEELPELAETKRRRYQSDWDLSEYESDIITSHPSLARMFEETVKLSGRPRDAASWIMGELMQLSKERRTELSESGLQPSDLARLIILVEQGTVNRITAKKVLAAVIDKNVDPERYIEENQLSMVGGDKLLRDTVIKVIGDNPQSLQDYKAGKTKAAGFLVGQAMRLLKGTADPQKLNQIVQEELARY